MSDTIGEPSLNLRAKYADLFSDVQKANAGVAAEFQKGNKKLEAQQRATMREMQATIDRISGRRATDEINLIAQAVKEMGGASSLSGGALKRLTADVDRLRAAGARIPASLQGLGGGKLSQIFSGFSTGGITGGLAAIGPAGLAASAAIGGVVTAATAGVHAMAELASQAEGWTNTAKSTGLGVQTVQQLTAYLEDAGLGGVDLKKVMKELGAEIATGGKQVAKFGIGISDLKGLSPEEQLRKMAGMIAAITDEETRGAAATAAFGKQGYELVAALDGIASGADKAFKAFDDAQTAALTHADVVLDEFSRKWKDLKKQFLATVAEFVMNVPSMPVTAAGALPGYSGPAVPGIAYTGPTKPTGPVGPSKEELGATPAAIAAAAAEAARQRAQKEYEAAAAALRAAETAAQESRALAVQAFREQVTSLSEIAAWETKLLALGMKRSQVEALVSAKTKEIAAAGQKQMDEAIRAAAAQRAEGSKLSKELETSTKETKDRAEAERRSMEYLSDEIGFAGRFALGLRNAGRPTAEIRDSLIRIGFKADEADKIIAKWAPVFEDVAVAAAEAGMSVDQIRAKLVAAGAKGDVLDKAMARIGHGPGSGLNTFADGLARAGDELAGMGGAVGIIGSAMSALGNGASAFNEYLQTGTVNANKMAGAIQGVAGALGAAGEALGGYQTGWGGLLSGAGTGAQMGSSFGGYGALIGAGAGAAVGGLVGSGNETETTEERWRDIWKRMRRYIEANPNEQFGGKTGGVGWEALFAQAEQWGLNLREAYEEGGTALMNSMDKYLELAEAAREQIEKEVAKQEAYKASLNEAKAGAQMLLDSIANADLSDAARKAANFLVGKIRQALLAAGMGAQLDERLAKSEKYQAAQGVAQGAAQLLAGARKAGGIYDESMGKAGGEVAESAKQAAYEAAKKAGLSEEAAQKAGFGAVSDLLREQLNNSLQSDTALDAKTQQLIDEAKKNGINILADPAIAQLKVQRDILAAVLSGNAGPGSSVPGDKGGKTTPPPGGGSTGDAHEKWHQQHPGQDHPPGAYSAATGIFKTVRTPDLGRGLSWNMQLHPEEEMAVLPKGTAPHGAFVIPVDVMRSLSHGPRGFRSAAAGLSSPIPWLSGGRSNVPSQRSALAAIAASAGVDLGAGGGSRSAPLSLTMPISTTNNINESPFASSESKAEARRFTLDETRRALEEGSHPIAMTVKRMIRSEMSR